MSSAFNLKDVLSKLDTMNEKELREAFTDLAKSSDSKINQIIDDCTRIVNSVINNSKNIIDKSSNDELNNLLKNLEKCRRLVTISQKTT